MSAAVGIDVQRLQAMLSRSAFHRWLDLRVVAVTDDQVEVVAPWRDELMSNPEARIMHGGILAALVDATADLALGARLGHTLPTIDLRIDYHKPAVECALRAIGRVVKLGRTIATAEASVYDPAGALIASGRCAFLVQKFGSSR